MWQCFYCRLPLPLDVQAKNRLCPSCGSDLHCCRNCTHFNESLNSKCDEPNSEWVRDRTHQNNCDLFEFKNLRVHPTAEPKTDTSTEAERAKEAFRALFRS